MLRVFLYFFVYFFCVLMLFLIIFANKKEFCRIVLKLFARGDIIVVNLTIKFSCKKGNYSDEKAYAWK